MAVEEGKSSRKRARRSKGSQTDTDEDFAIQPCCCQETLDKINEKLDLALAATQEIQDLKEQVSTLKKESKDLEESLKFAHDEIKELKVDVKLLTDSIDSIQQSTDQLSNDLFIERARGVKLESHSRRNNLRFYNIPEKNNESYEDAEESLREFLNKDLKGGQTLANSIKLERVHRTGAKRSDKPRPLIAKFSFFKEKEHIRKMAKNLKGTPFSIAEDYPYEILQVRKNLVPLLKDAQSQGKKAYLKYDQLIINGEIYKGPKAYRSYVFDRSGE